MYSTADWPRAFQQTVTLNPGDWPGFIIQESSVAAGYVIEINPLSRRGVLATGWRRRWCSQNSRPPIWWDVLRMQIPAAQSPLEAEVIVYQTPARPAGGDGI